MRSLVFTILLGLVAVVYAQQCHMCEVLVNNIIANHPNGFDDVTDAQLTQEMEDDCVKQFGAQYKALCDQYMPQLEPGLMTSLRNGENAHQCCVDGGMC